MLNINNYNDFYEDMLLESIENGESMFVISKELHDVLEKMVHPIAKKLLHTYMHGKEKKQTFIDIVNNKYDKFYFVMSNKVISFIKDKHVNIDDTSVYQTLISIHKKTILNKYKAEIKIGKLINKLFPDEFKPNGDKGNDIESFMNDYAMMFEIDEDMFDIVKGEDIIDWYDGDEYEKDNDSVSLRHSCMRYPPCAQFIEFYAINPTKVSMLILYSDGAKKKINARALLWNLSTIDYEDTDKKFMDRVYYNQNEHLIAMLSYAKKNEYLYKDKQNSAPDTKIFDPKENESKRIHMEILGMEVPNHVQMPYMDTMLMYNPFDKVLTNNEDVSYDYTALDGTDGESKLIYSNVYKEVFNTMSDRIKYSKQMKGYYKTEDLVHVKYYDFYTTKERFEEDKKNGHYVFSKKHDAYVLKTDVIYSKKHDDYLLIKDDDVVYIPYVSDALLREEIVFSDHLAQNIPIDDAIWVYRGAEKASYYITSKDDKTSDHFEYNGDYYMSYITKDEIDDQD